MNDAIHPLSRSPKGCAMHIFAPIHSWFNPCSFLSRRYKDNITTGTIKRQTLSSSNRRHHSNEVASLYTMYKLYMYTRRGSFSLSVSLSFMLKGLLLVACTQQSRHSLWWIILRLLSTLSLAPPSQHPRGRNLVMKVSINFADWGFFKWPGQRCACTFRKGEI